MASDRSWHLVITPRAERDLKRLPLASKARIVKAIDSLAADPRHGDVKKLQGLENTWRLRSGDWRIFFTFAPHEGTIYVLGVRHRRDAYR